MDICPLASRTQLYHPRYITSLRTSSSLLEFLGSPSFPTLLDYGVLIRLVFWLPHSSRVLGRLPIRTTPRIAPIQLMVVFQHLAIKTGPQGMMWIRTLLFQLRAAPCYSFTMEMVDEKKVAILLVLASRNRMA